MTKPKPKTATKPGPRPGTNAKVTDALYEQILLWYVQNGNQHAKAAAHFGLGRRTLTGLYFQGAKHLNKPAMKTLINTVEVRARALRASMKEEELARAEEEMQAIINGTSTSELARSVDDAARARAEEGAVVAAGRRNILNLQAMLQPLLKSAATRVKQLERDVQEMGPEDVLKYLRDLTKFQSDLTTAAKTNMEMERLLMGAGDDAAHDRPAINHPEAIRLLELGAKTLNRMKAGGRLIEGSGEEISRVTVDPFDDVEEEEGDDEPPQVEVH